MSTLYGLMGYAQSGKDSVADAMSLHGVRRFAFADALKHAAHASLERVRPDLYDLVTHEGWDAAKQTADGRAYLQDFGVAMRDHVDQDVWVNTVLNKVGVFTMQGTTCAVTDVRFHNEVWALQAQGAILVRVNRPGVGPVNDHVSEAEWTSVEPDEVLDNDGSLADLGRKVTDLLQRTSASWGLS